MEIVKRNGNKEVISIEKIHKAVTWACDGLDVSLSAIETGAHIQFFDGIKSEQIQRALINSAASLIDKDKMDYEYAAARLLLQQIYKEVTGGSIQYPPMFDYVAIAITENRLSKDMLDFDFDMIDAAIDQSRDLKFKYLGMQTVYDRYLIRAEPTDDQIVGDLIELPQHFWMRVAMGIALNETPETRTEWAIKFYDLLSNFKFVNSTPTLFNSGTQHSQMSSCYVVTVNDSIWEHDEKASNLGKGIFASTTECALYSKFSGGIGADWTRVRPTGGHIKSTNGVSSGIIPYLKAFNDTSVAVNQCHAPETLIHTSKGVKRIDDVNVGDLVLGQHGNYRAVLDVMKYEQGDDLMVSIDVKHSSSPMLITAGHPIFAIAGVAKQQSISRTMSQLKSGKLKVEWVDAGNIKEGDYVAQVVPKEVNIVLDFTDDDARMYGTMLGDGHCSKRLGKSKVLTIEWGLTGITDESTIVFARDYLTKRGIHFYESNVGSVGSKAIQIKWSNGGKALERDELGRRKKSVACMPFDYSDLYDENHKKRIANRFNSLQESQTIAMLQGLIESDGNISRGKEITFCNTSEQLIEDVRYQCLRLGIPTSANKRVRSITHLSGNGETSISWDVRIPAVEKIAKVVGSKIVTKQNWLELNGAIFSRVKSASSIDPVEFVYDLKIDGDHTYMTTSALVHNGGKRAGSFAVYLEPWHGDIERFLDLKKPNGDERLRARELFPALWTNDLFMERVRDKKQWSLFCSSKNPQLHELYGDDFKIAYELAEARGDAIRTVDAFDLWKKIITALVESGAPWITFKDEMNRRNPQSHDGVIHSSNLCTEISLNNSDSESAVCNLGSINVAECNPTEFEVIIPIAMRMLDNVIDLNFYPTDKARKSNLRHRPVGLGIMGWTDYIVAKGIDWESEEHLRETDKVFEQFSYWAIRGSIFLAKERGSYETYQGSKWSNNILPIDTARELPSSWYSTTHTVAWALLREDLKRYGIRNSNCTSIAPTATIANIVGTTPCIEPTFKQVFVKESKSGKFKIVDPSMRHNRHDLCKIAFNIDQKWIIKAAAVRQKWLCQSQSVNLFKHAMAKGSEISEWYFLAWELGLKATYYLKQQISQLTAEESGVENNVETNKDYSSNEALMCSLENPEACESCQ